jgi:hypothetical protein
MDFDCIRSIENRGVGELVAEGGLEPPADEAYETPALPTELFRDLEPGEGIEPPKQESKPCGLPLTEPAPNWYPLTVPTRLRRLERPQS